MSKTTNSAKRQEGDSTLRKLKAAYPDAEQWRDIAWAEIQKLALGRRREDPALTEAQAVSEVLESRKGRDLYAMYSGPDAKLPLAEAVQKRRIKIAAERLGYVDWRDTEWQLAKQLSPDDPAGRGMRLVVKNCPSVHELAMDERRNR